MKCLWSLWALSWLWIAKVSDAAAAVKSEGDTSVEAPTADIAPKYTPPEGAETFAFEAEVNRMLDIVVNSLYQNKDVFLRELISNAADALDKYRYLSLTEPEKYKKSSENDTLQIELEYDKDAKTLTIRDTGIGMTKQDMIDNLGTVARSGTTKFVQALKESGKDKDVTIDQIGQFGVGFYSAFLVADRITVASHHPLSSKQYIWECTNGSSDFVVYEDPRGITLTRGTEVSLHLRPDSTDYLDAARLKSLASHYSEFVTHPIRLRTTKTMEVEVDDDDDDLDSSSKKADDLEIKDDDLEKIKTTKDVTTYSWDVLNSNKAIWLRDKDTITDDEYQGFFHLINDNEHVNASTWAHFNAEGNVNFRSILYLPSEKPPSYDLGHIDGVDTQIRLYVKRILIANDFDLLPRYLSFIKGIVDSDELPLNVNRETLQESKILKVIKKKLTRKALDLIRDFAKKSADDAAAAAETKKTDEAEISPDGGIDITPKKEKSADKYLEWHSKFGINLKLGAIEDEPNRAKLLKLVRFQTSKSNGTFVPLSEYIDRMKDWQDTIFILGGPTLEDIKKSPFLETFKEKDVEVVYLSDTIDEYMIKHVRDYEGKKFTDVSTESVKFKDEDDDLLKRREKAYQKKFKPLTKWLKSLFTAGILRVQVAKRSLGSMPAVVSSTDFGTSANMERILKAQAFQQENPMMGYGSMKVFEINPRHPLIVKLLEGIPDNLEEGKEFEANQDQIDSAWMLYDIALLNGGFPIADPVAHNKRMLKVLKSKYGLDSLALEPEINPPVEDDEPPTPDMDLDSLNFGDFANMGGGNIDDLDLDSL